MSRKSKVSSEAANFAIELRKQGLTYQEIVKELKGEVSIDWCKRNLTNKDSTPSALAKKAILQDSLRPEGIANMEAHQHILDVGLYKERVNGDEEDTMYEIYKPIKNNILRYNEAALFRPNWMRKDAAISSTKRLFKYGDRLNTMLEEAVNDFMCEMFPDDYNNKYIRQSVAYDLACLAFPFKVPEGIINRCTRLVSLSEKVAERVGSDEKVVMESLGKLFPEGSSEIMGLPY